MDAMCAVDLRPNHVIEDALLTDEIQAFCYRRVLKIIHQTGCGYQEAWQRFQKEIEERLDKRKKGG